MIVFITGATGFIGRRLTAALRAAGHRVIEARRDCEHSSDCVSADFTRDFDVDVWTARLAGVDIVINAVGILREHGKQTFDSVHTRAPCALFAACVTAGVKKVVQISALGAQTGRTGYFKSKHAADEYLTQLPLAWTIVRPSLIFGAGGTSARLFCLLASLPIIPLPGRGSQPVQPIHIDDAVTAIVAIVEGNEMNGRRVALVGPAPLTLKEFLQCLRRSMQLPSAHVLNVPWAIMTTSARIAELTPGSLLDRETLIMLEAGNTAPPDDTKQLLRGSPRAAERLIAEEHSASQRQQAQLAWLLPMLRISIALVWIWTGIVSLGLYPPRDSYELLARVGVSGALAPLMLYGAAVLDLLVGFATLVLRRRRLLWLLQLVVIFGYTLIITFKLPEFWLHPYGPLSKNLVMLAAIYLLYVLEPRRWNISS